MNPMKLDPLDVDHIKELISLLQSALQGGFLTSTSSPVEILLESITDISLMLSTMFTEGTKGQKSNEGLKFSERYSDPLGNPKQLKIPFETRIFWDPETALFFKELASMMVHLKRGDTFRVAFMAIHKAFSNLQPPVVSQRDSHQGVRKKMDKQKTRLSVYRRFQDK
jgi:hypothetical protein